MNLSPNFTLFEMTRSLAHPDIPNVPNADQIAAMGLLCANVLEKIREHFGKPVIVRSGFRSPELNAATKNSAKRSEHMEGLAADIEIYGVPNDEIYRYIVSSGIEFKKVIAEYLRENDCSAGWIHVSHQYANNTREQLSCIAPKTYVKGLQYVA